MKKIFTILLGSFLITGSANAQDRSENSGQATKMVYGEFGGSGLLFSGNFDTRFKGHKGLGMRIGAGLIASEGAAIFTFPVGLNVVSGKGPHYFEFGATATLLTATYGGFDEGSSGWFFMPHLGYRFTKPENSFNGRIYIGPVIADGFVFFPFGGLSVGYTLPFKK